jgi:hypothetical protein
LRQFASYIGFEQIQLRPQLRDFSPQITGQYFTGDHRKITLVFDVRRAPLCTTAPSEARGAETKA